MIELAILMGSCTEHHFSTQVRYLPVGLGQRLQSVLERKEKSKFAATAVYLLHFNYRLLIQKGNHLQTRVMYAVIFLLLHNNPDTLSNPN